MFTPIAPRLALAALMVGLIPTAIPAAEEPPPPRVSTGAVFQIKDGVLHRNGEPFLLSMDFTWSCTPNQDFLRFWKGFGGTAHLCTDSPFLANGEPDRARIDRELRACAEQGLHLLLMPNITDMGYAYAQAHPEARMLGPDGAPLTMNNGYSFYASYLHEGYRQALAARLTKLAACVKDQPAFLGYYLCDEFSYPGWGDYSEHAVNLFRKKMEAKYGNLAALNAAWKTSLAAWKDLAPPKAAETTARFADWQEFRRWAYTDMVAFAAGALKGVDPGHVTLNSMDFGLGNNLYATAWWAMPPPLDIMIRHGISYYLPHNLILIREIAARRGKAGAALSMPPGCEVPFLSFMYMLDGSPSGLSAVCPAGHPGNQVYMGVADSDAGFRPREPQYTQAKAFYQLQHYLGATYLLAKRRKPEVGFLVSDRTCYVTGVKAETVSGIMQLLTDLNVDFETVSEYTSAPLQRFKVLIVGPAAALADGALAAEVAEFVAGGGKVILMPGAFARNERNEPADPARVPLLGRFGGPVSAPLLLGKQEIAASFSAVNVNPSDQVVAADGQGRAGIVRTADSGGLIFGFDFGSAYYAGWKADFLGTAAGGDRDTLLRWAFNDAGMASNPLAKEGALPAQKHLGCLVGEFLARAGVKPGVTVAGYEAPAAVRAVSFTRDGEMWVGLANRMIKPGANLASWQWDRDQGVPGWDMADFHTPILKPVVSVTLPAGFPETCRAFRMPKNEERKGGLAACCRQLPVRIRREEAGRKAVVQLDRLDDWEALVLAPSYRVLPGLELKPRAILAGETTEVAVRLLNGTDRRVVRRVRVAADPRQLTVTPPEAEVALKPFEEKVLKFTAATSLAARPGSCHLQAVTAEGECSYDLELKINPLYRLTWKVAAGTSLSVEHDQPVSLGALELAADGLDGTAEVELDPLEGFALVGGAQRLKLAGKRKIELRCAFACDRPDATAVGRLRVKGTLSNGFTFAEELPIRLSRGLVSYRMPQQDLAETPANSAAGANQNAEMVCVENKRFIVCYLPDSGTLHDFVVRASGLDLFTPRSYPIGFVWYLWPNAWRFTAADTRADRIALNFVSTSPQGHPVSLRAELGRETDYLDVTYDARESEPVDKAFYLMSQMGVHGVCDQDRLRYPAKTGVVERVWQHGAELETLRPDQLAANWVTVWDRATGHYLTAAFAIPAMKSLQVSPGRNGFNYALLTPDPGQCPGLIRFRLFGGQGTGETLAEVEARAARTFANAP